ncbi:MAG: hypothetical protein H6626_05220 [Pseudobdellovibrionaceae bacterium]|nr:MAG: hypothetical protein H6626_05220 [Pseudobdellovibrionaceae bacterium]
MSDETTRPKKRRVQDSSRLSLSRKAQQMTENWMSQIKQEFHGMVNIKRNDLLNFLLEELDEILAPSILDKIKKEKLTGKQKAKWIYQKFLEAEKNGSEINFDELVKTAQSGSRKVKKQRKTKSSRPQNSLNKALCDAPMESKK